MFGPSPVTTTANIRSWCHAEATDGRVCALYSGHVPPHKEKHLASSWTDEECKRADSDGSD